MAGQVTWLRAIGYGAFFIETGFPEKGYGMKSIKKAENVIEENAGKEWKKTEQNVIVIDPHRHYDGLVSEIVGFLAERTAERFDIISDDMELSIFTQVARRLAFSSPEETVKMLQMLFLANGYTAEAEYLDILWMIAGHDEKAFDHFVDSLAHTEEFDMPWIVGSSDDVKEKVFLPFRCN